MCEKKSRKIKKGSHSTHLREARRIQRLQQLMSPPVERLPSPLVDKNAQCRLILELAWKTITLMQKNSMIQQRIVALQKETSEFVAAVMSNPENKRRYAEHMRLYGQHPQSLVLFPVKQNSTHI
ncbi:uncharacterized protein LOC113225532 [Hyposmocoma kahamanoa]|uniref:uncharacterized protein LOC113225532 n=1 Tax=Hyposmocoma kahamanoa TaxID=1477025 RepID=UPI000E6D8C5D|nr:uncharacterized protein LOC113225532 [Hyposmocoma kahamanoa]